MTRTTSLPLPTSQPQASMARRLAWLALVFVLLAAQTLGLVHRQVHAGALQALPGHPAAVASSVVAPATGVLAKAFSGHDAGDCRLIDQLGHGNPMPAMPLLVLPLLPTAYLLQAWQGAVLARWAALFDARGPPAAR